MVWQERVFEMGRWVRLEPWSAGSREMEHTVSQRRRVDLGFNRVQRWMQRSHRYVFKYIPVDGSSACTRASKPLSTQPQINTCVVCLCRRDPRHAVRSSTLLSQNKEGQVRSPLVVTVGSWQSCAGSTKPFLLRCLSRLLVRSHTLRHSMDHRSVPTGSLLQCWG